MEKFDFNVKLCLKSKEILKRNKDIAGNITRNKYTKSGYIGNCMYLYNLLKPNDYEDFYNKILDYAESHKEIRVENRGLTYEELYHLAEEFKKETEENGGINTGLNIYFYTLVCHLVIETFDGAKAEELLTDYFKENGADVSKVDPVIDTRYGLDLDVKKDGTRFFVQVKPISFFLGKNLHTMKDKVKICVKREEVLEKYGINTYYAIYDIDKEECRIRWVTNQKGKILFKIEELFAYDKDIIMNTDIEPFQEKDKDRINEMLNQYKLPETRTVL